MTDLQDTLGHRFNNQALLTLALTHSSYAHERGGHDNERLEFLGDAVLQLALTEVLMRRFPRAREGELSQLRAMVVDTDTLHQVALELGLGPHLRLGVGEARGGGRTRRRVLACATEAVLGAIFEDAGFRAAQGAVRRWFMSRVEGLSAPKALDTRSRLQQITQREEGLSPTYTIDHTEGPPHKPTFTASVHLGDRCLGQGTGSTKQGAYKDAAAAALRSLSEP